MIQNLLELLKRKGMCWFDYDLDDFEESLRENSSELIGEDDDYGNVLNAIVLLYICQS